MEWQFSGWCQIVSTQMRHRVSAGMMGCKSELKLIYAEMLAERHTGISYSFYLIKRDVKHRNYNAKAHFGESL